MLRPVRYLLALVTATAVTLGVTVEHDSLVLLVGVFGTYGATAALSLRYPSLLWNRGSRTGRLNIASGVVAGGSTFGILTLAQGLGETTHLGAAVMGFGLVWFGVAGGIWMVDAGEIPLGPSGSDRGTSGDSR